jgi:hypothetical protein
MTFLSALFGAMASAGRATAAAIPAVLTPVAQAIARFGFNGPPALGPATDTYVYADAARGAPNYMPVLSGNVANWPVRAVPLDASGNPLGDFSIALTFQTDPAANAPGPFTLIFTGKATVSPYFGTMTVTSLGHDTATNTSRYSVTQSSGGAVTVTFSGANSGFDASTIKLIRPGMSETDKYDPRFVSLYSRGQMVRFMDWTQTNSCGSMVPYLQKRRFGCGWVEALEMCNDLQKDAWICVPHGYTDQAIRDLLTYWRDNLSASQKLRVEWSNEIWNYTLGTQFSEVRLWGIDEAGLMTAAYTKTSTVCSVDLDETAQAADATTRVKFQSFRRVAGEVFVKHTGLVRYRTGERYKVTSRGSTAALALIDALVPALNASVVITVTSPTEFKYSLAGADAAEVHVSGVPTFTHTPILSVSMTGGVVTVVHDGSRTFTNGQQIAVGSSAGALSGMRQYTPVPVTVVDGATFTYQPTTLGADIAAVTAFSPSAYISVATDPSNPYMAPQSNGNSILTADPSVFGQRLTVRRIQQIALIAKEVFGSGFGSRCEIVYSDKNFEFGPFGASREAFLWWEGAFKAAVGEINTWLHYIAHAPYIYLTSAELASVSADTTGDSAAQILVDKAPTQYAYSWRWQVGWARRYGVKTSCYEAGIDTMGNPTSNVTTFTLQLRNAINANPKMRQFTKALADALVRYGVGEQMYYLGTIGATLDTVTSTGSAADCWDVAQTMSSIQPIGTPDPKAPKLAGIDDYILGGLVDPVGHFSPGVTFTPSVNSSDHAFFELDSRGPAKTAVVGAAQLQSSQRGGYMIYSQGSFAAGYGWPKVTFVAYHGTGGVANLFMDWKHDPDATTTIDILVDGVIQQTITNPSPTTQVVFDSTSGFVETGPYPITMPKGPCLLSIVLRARQTSSQQLVFKSLRLA